MHDVQKLGGIALCLGLTNSFADASSVARITEGLSVFRCEEVSPALWISAATEIRGDSGESAKDLQGKDRTKVRPRLMLPQNPTLRVPSQTLRPMWDRPRPFASIEECRKSFAEDVLKVL